jgi:hypothetical protein
MNEMILQVRRYALCFVTAFSLTATSADAQFAGLLGKGFGLPAKGEVGGSYQSNNQIRTFITTDPYGTASIYDKLITKASEMAADRGFTRIGVTKNSCSTAAISERPRLTSCYIIAVMLHELETVAQRGNREVRYYFVKDVSRGAIAPLPVTR